MSFLSNFRVVLVRAENPINIGQAARAMKNFGIPKLVLVQCADHQTPEALTVGWKARHILGSAELHETLSEALQESSLAVGFTARKGKRRGVPRSFPEVVPELFELAGTRKVSLVFGNEKNGLSNAELSQCHIMTTIPVRKEYASLNLAHAVAIAAFCVFQHTEGKDQIFKKPDRFYTRPEEYEALMRDFYRILVRLDYQDVPRKALLSTVSDQIRHFFKKATLERRELHLFKAFLQRVEQRLIRLERQSKRTRS